MTTINIKVINLDNVQKALDNLTEKINNPPEQLMRRLGETAIEDIDQRFMTRGYGTWAPLKPSTIKRKGNSMVLIDTGAMLSSVNISKLTQDSVEVDVPFGGKTRNPKVPVFHQEGTKRMPQRKIIEVTPRLKQALASTLEKWVSDITKAFAKGM